MKVYEGKRRYFKVYGGNKCREFQLYEGKRRKLDGGI